MSEPLDGLTSAVEAATLRVLARADAGFSGRQVHSLAGVGSTLSVHRALSGGRRDSSLDSDVDLFVVYPDAIDDDARAHFSYQIAAHVERITGNEAQVFSVERAELARRIDENDALVANVLVDDILVFGPALGLAKGRAA